MLTDSRSLPEARSRATKMKRCDPPESRRAPRRRSAFSGMTLDCTYHHPHSRNSRLYHWRRRRCRRHVSWLGCGRHVYLAEQIEDGSSVGNTHAWGRGVAHSVCMEEGHQRWQSCRALTAAVRDYLHSVPCGRPRDRRYCWHTIDRAVTMRPTKADRISRPCLLLRLVKLAAAAQMTANVSQLSNALFAGLRSALVDPASLIATPAGTCA